MDRTEALRIEQIPYLQHHEGGEEQRKFVDIDARRAVSLTIKEERHHDGEEQKTAE